MPKFLEVGKENIKKKFWIKAPRIPLKDEDPSQKFLFRGRIQNGGTHDFEDVSFYCFQLSSTNDNAFPSYCFVL